MSVAGSVHLGIGTRAISSPQPRSSSRHAARAPVVSLRSRPDPPVANSTAARAPRVGPPPPSASAGDASAPAFESDSRWQRTVTRVSQAVVVIKTTGTRAFDTESAGSSYATGFVVDKRLGIILTNRHVLRPGPVVAEAVFQNREEVPLRALYCDPVHDFAFFRFDPAAVAFHRVEEVPLAPDAASVGLEVRVVGNDSGETLHPLRHPRATRSRRPQIRKHRVQRFQHVLRPGGERHQGRVQRLARGGRPRSRRGAQRGVKDEGFVGVLPPVTPRGARAVVVARGVSRGCRWGADTRGVDVERTGRAAGDAADDASRIRDSTSAADWACEGKPRRTCARRREREARARSSSKTPSQEDLARESYGWATFSSP